MDDDLSLSQIQVEFFNSTTILPTAHFSCTATTQNEDISGFILDWESNSTTTTGAGYFAFMGLTSTSGNEGTYSVTCAMNHADSIYHIYVRETTDTGATD